ncbi:P-loop containing nucleoside triphosphate hydrolase protein [Mycena latifolia]|nr:P-loop containing nucleoside triphosphate hydrolase protein [Mycena latifolia]
MAPNAPQTDRRGASRTVPMKVLVLGFFRTGTKSMQVALETLGYHKTHHGGSPIYNPVERDMWVNVVNAKFVGKGKPVGREEFDELLGHCQAAVADGPCLLFAEELIAAYPDAKVILTNRDPAKWWKSYQESLQFLYRSKKLMFAGWLDPEDLGKGVEFSSLTPRIMLGSAAGAEEEESKARFVAHYEKIRRIVPKERLLEYEVGEGWDRLCAFLGHEVPDTDFPRLNDTKALRQLVDIWVHQVFRRAAARLLVPAALLIAVCFAVYVT